MTSTAIKLIGLIVLLYCSCQSAHGISIAASINGVSTQFNIQADESSSIVGGLSLDNMGLETVFSGSNIKKFNHTYEYPDSEGNKAILSVELEKAKKVHLSVSPVTGFAEASETVSVKDADLIKTGSQAITSEGDTAKVELKIIEGSLQSYKNYANANLINEFGEKTFVAWQRANIASGKMVESSAQATYASGDVSLPPVSQVNSKMVVTNGQISELFSEAGRHTDFYSWDDGYYNWSSAYHDIYVNQSAGGIGRTASIGKNPPTIAMIFESETSAIDSEGNTARLKTSMLEGTINNYSDEAYAGSNLYTESFSDGSYNSHGSGNWTSAWQNTGHITSNVFKTRVLAAEKDKNAAMLSTSIIGGTVNGYNNGAGAGSSYYYNSNGYIEATRNANAGWAAADAIARDFETYMSAANADGDRAFLMTSLLDGAFNGYWSNTMDASTGSYFSPKEGFREYKYASSDQFIGALNAGSLTSSLIASGINGSKSIVSLNASDAYVENLYSYGRVSNEGANEVPRAEAFNQADFISGSLIEAQSYSRDQISNATYAAMELEGTDNKNGSIAGYVQLALTDPMYEYYPLTYAWIRSITSASGNGTFHAWATNGMETKALGATAILDNDTFTNFGRVKDGSPGTYFSIPDTGVDPWNFIF